MTKPSSLSNNCIPDAEIPVLLTIFNRPDKTKAVIENLRQIRPKRLFVAADGPRLDHPQDTEKCRLAREEATNVDWACEIKTMFLDDNVGCDPAVSSAIDWFFQNVECGIILEDDCIVHPHFFAFCGELFIKYYDDQRVMQISSLSPYAERDHIYDYHFSRIFRCSGGWATWRRAWHHFTSDIHRYSDKEALAILKAYHRDYYMCLWEYKRLRAYKKGILTVNKGGVVIKQRWGHWDYQWNLACAAQNGLCIVPERNLMVNIGFDEDSTNTKDINAVFENLQYQPLLFPLRHPVFVYADSEPERSLEKRTYRRLSFKSCCIYLLRRASGAIHYLREIMPFG